MRRPIEPCDRRPMSERPQPLTEPGVKHPQQFQDEDEEDAVRRWLGMWRRGGLADV